MKRDEILDRYNISDATIRNWKKLNYIDNIADIDPMVIENILKNKTSVRRNKKISSSNMVPVSYVDDKRIVHVINGIILIKNKYGVSDNAVLNEVINILLNRAKRQVPSSVHEILGERLLNHNFECELRRLDFSFNSDNDFLGALYMSLLSVGVKDVNGIFYTPFNVVHKMVSSIKFELGKRIVDPGCGSGNFLLQVFKKMKETGLSSLDIINCLYGYDVDPIAVLLAKINLYLLDENLPFESINIQTKNFLTDDVYENFDIVIGNPPWGKKYTKKEKEVIKNKYGLGFSKYDSFAQFIFRSFELLNTNGLLSFVLPSSVLNIAVHKDVRDFILNNKIISIDRIGKRFHEIVTDVVVIKVLKEHNLDNICLYDGFKVLQNSFRNNPNFNFLVSDDISKGILSKLKNYDCYHLDSDGIGYALGVVTGDNKKFLSSSKNSFNEPIISGKDISKYVFDYSKVNNFISFDEFHLQQVADEKFYRDTNKIIYKFIGKKLYFAVETKGLLTLNSANVICFPKSMDIYYISSILNSRVTQLYFDEMYDTNKLLKNHIQSFFIPNFRKDIQDKISCLCKNMAFQDSYNENIENIIFNELNLTAKDVSYLKRCYPGMGI